MHLLFLVINIHCQKPLPPKLKYMTIILHHLTQDNKWYQNVELNYCVFAIATMLHKHYKTQVLQQYS